MSHDSSFKCWYRLQDIAKHCIKPTEKLKNHLWNLSKGICFLLTELCLQPGCCRGYHSMSLRHQEDTLGGVPYESIRPGEIVIGDVVAALLLKVF